MKLCRFFHFIETNHDSLSHASANTLKLSCNLNWIVSIIRCQPKTWMELISNFKHFFYWWIECCISGFDFLLVKLLVSSVVFCGAFTNDGSFLLAYYIVNASHVSRYFRFVNSNRLYFLLLFPSNRDDKFILLLFIDWSHRFHALIFN